MLDLNPAASTDPFPDWPFGVDSSTDRRVIGRDEYVRVPLDVAECPHCHFMLKAKPGIIVVDENGTRWIDTISMSCRSGAKENGYCREHEVWPSVEKRVRDWMRRTYQAPPRGHTVDPVKAALFEQQAE